MAEGGRPAMEIAAHHENRIGIAAKFPPDGVESLQPMLAGARARGMADAFDLLGLPAIFLDDDGRALHISERASGLMRNALFIAEGRLKAVSGAADAALQEAVDAALAGRAAVEPIVVAGPASKRALSLRILSVTGQDESAQMLRAIVLFDYAGAHARHGLI